MMNERKVELQKSIKRLRQLVLAAEKADPELRRLQMFGGNIKKEKAFNQRLEDLKEKFYLNVYNINKRKEALLFGNKLNKLITLVKKATKDEVINELVDDIDQELFKKMKVVQKKLQFVSKDSNPELQ